MNEITINHALEEIITSQQPASAERECRKAIRLEPDFAEAHFNLGCVLHQKGDLNGAIQELREAVRLQPDYAIAHFNLGCVLGIKGDLVGAEREYGEAIGLRPDDADAHIGLGYFIHFLFGILVSFLASYSAICFCAHL